MLLYRATTTTIPRAPRRAAAVEARDNLVPAFVCKLAFAEFVFEPEPLPVSAAAGTTVMDVTTLCAPFSSVVLYTTCWVIELGLSSGGEVVGVDSLVETIAGVLDVAVGDEGGADLEVEKED